MKALTIHQPWAWAIAAGLKPVENRTWMTHHRGFLAIHAGVPAGNKQDFRASVEHVAVLTDRAEADIIDAGHVRGAVVAVATLTGVCSATRYPGSSVRNACDCGPWAIGGQRHFQLTEVRALLSPVAVRGAQKMWDLPDDVESAVRAQLGQNLTEVTR